MSNAYEIWVYSINKLKEVLVETTLSTPEIVDSKLHTIYFNEYFDKLKAKAFIVEYDYIDHDFLDDFSNYYVKCFKTYERKCARLHFFKIQIEREEFDNYLNGKKSRLTEKKLNGSYLGFLVIKPLPRTIIGRTCLKTYPPENRRFYPALREYEATLFGIRLKVISLAYQEQDNVVAACATSALWSVFNSTGRLFQHPIPSPVEISEAACATLPLESRFFPNPGLSSPRMAQAIRAIGLEPFLINATDQQNLKAAAYAYLKCKIPLILGMNIIDLPTYTFKKASDGNNLHAVALTGFSLGNLEPTPYLQTRLLMISSKIDKLYAHDDQVGPFSRMILDQYDSGLKTEEGDKIKTIRGSWKGSNGKIGDSCATPELILVPLYNKIRLPLKLIIKTINQFDETIESIVTAGILPYDEKFVWDIYLTTVNEFKSGMIASNQWSNSLRHQVLIKSMPKYIWRATALYKNQSIIDFLFDATDLEQSSSLFLAVGYDEAFFETLVKISKTQNRSTYFYGEAWRIGEWFSGLKI